MVILNDGSVEKVIIDAIKQVIAEEYGSKNVIDIMTYISNLTVYDMQNEGANVEKTEINTFGHVMVIRSVDNLRYHPQREGMDDLVEIRLVHKTEGPAYRLVVITMNYNDKFEWEIERKETDA
jgi:hypothetical protein